MSNAKQDIWAALAAPLPKTVIQWRQQGRPTARDGKQFARFVAYIDAQFVRERFDAVIPGEWDLTLELLPPAITTDGEEVEPFSFKARLQVLGVIRESVGAGKDYKTAETDAFKRAAVRFGVGSELYAMEHLWVQMDGDGKYAKPLEDPAAVYAKRSAWKTPDAKPLPSYDAETAYAPTPAKGAAASGTDDIGATNGPPADDVACPKCGSRCYDNRAENDARLARGEKLRPDWKCRDRNCDGVIWRPKDDRRKAAPVQLEEIPF